MGEEENELATAHTDLAPTFLELATGKVGKGLGWEGLDGSPIPLVEGSKREGRQEHVNVEFWGRSIAEGTYGFSLDDGRYGEFLISCFGDELLLG